MWRSGLGVTANGALVYVGGPGLDIVDLANILVKAGAVRAMELDINTDWVNYSIYQPSTPTGAATATNGTLVVARHDWRTGPLLRVLVGPRLHHDVGGQPEPRLTLCTTRSATPNRSSSSAAPPTSLGRSSTSWPSSDAAPWFSPGATRRRWKEPPARSAARLPMWQPLASMQPSTDDVDKTVPLCFEAASEPVDLVIMAVGELGLQETDEVRSAAESRR